ncbi:sensor histidine kinase [Aquirufa antheringensis]|jgi:two-component system, OmpR family, phosphate regulon sensor histidine kinase PhoR|uniref:histidine kinase n=1 Tax=Aquirufa antheringensis TaxID=2516559 RepID=A0A4V2IVL8_9BACT|nr:HAMP domain-containing sensor histidine kinase [Aquirufa antheringensis]MCZ2485307.1 GHKL domain-containing protein [Aquirufa antheringensis]MCZ2488296.1 GHKL domain-containing protein [Aquirufa antheringensis]MCZ2490161.1 GHKL domain-containing protein [Aquirufa antheringensis]TBH72205.1 GHKL domain-containing protein [Aquirufa antheringensis]USQ03849.1 GHKL domain-containing protein [Aquirufa antheringensis]
MSKRKIRLLIALMSFALLGLIGFQAYWLRFMVEAKRENFAKDVRNSLEQVVRKLEKQEILVLAERQKKFESVATKTAKPKPTPAYVPDPVIQEEHPVLIQPRQDVIFVRKSFMLPNGQLAEVTEEYTVDEDPEELKQRVQVEKEMNRIIKREQQKILKKMRRRSNRVIQNLGDRQAQIQAKLVQEKSERQDLEKVLQKTQLAKEVFSDFLFKERPILQRIQPGYLDSLIRKELADKGVNLTYSFGIQSSPKTWSYISSPEIKQQKAIFEAALFPNDIHPSKNVLKIYFPDSGTYIWQTMGLSLAGSGLLLLVMIGCFYFAVLTILRQKKLALVKNDFINNMTHEFKTPITSISLATQLLQEELKPGKNESMLRYLGIIKEENTRLGQQVERVLQTAQMEREEITLKRKSVDVAALIQHVAEINGPLLDSVNGVLSLQLADLPPHISLDEVHISNVLNNLVDNAVKYSPANPKVEIKAREQDQGIVIEVKDQGMGMPKEALSNIFDAFYRVPTGNVHNVKGFGLGLSYVKKIVEAHGGKVNVKSKLGEGSTFEIYLPYVKDA